MKTDSVLNSILTSFAVDINPVFCNLILFDPIDEMRCHSRVAPIYQKPNYKDPKLCFKYGPSSSCYSQFVELAKNPNMCDLIGESPHNFGSAQCYVDSAYLFNNTKICDKISDYTLDYFSNELIKNQTKQKCINKSNYIPDLDLAFKENPSQCEELSDFSRRIDCFSRIAIRNKNETICDMIEVYILNYTKTVSEKQYKNVCLAKIRQDATLCSERRSNLEDCCIQDIAKATGNKELCKKVQQSSIEYLPCTRDKCNENLALLTNGSSCNEIENRIRREWCMLQVYAKNEDSAGCQKINNNLIKGYCIFLVSRANGNKSLCASITDKHTSDVCNQ
jgi:hypothetical protein